MEPMSVSENIAYGLALKRSDTGNIDILCPEAEGSPKDQDPCTAAPAVATDDTYKIPLCDLSDHSPTYEDLDEYTPYAPSASPTGERASQGSTVASDQSFTVADTL